MDVLVESKKYRYPGIRPFSQNQNEIFYGREDDVEALYRLISLQQEVLLYGKSGLGKSSLINAGLIPRMEKNGKYKCILIRFGGYTSGSVDSPLKSTKSIIKQVLKEDPKSDLQNILLEDSSLWRVLKDYQIGKGINNFVLIFDQFEELFTYPKEFVEEFKEGMSEALFSQIPQRYRDKIEADILANKLNPEADILMQLDEPLLIKTLFAIREDKMSLLNELVHHIPNILKNNFQLEALNMKQTEEAILNPAFVNNEAFISPVFDFEDSAIEYITAYLTKNNTQRTEPFQLQILCESIEQKIIRDGSKYVTMDSVRDIDSIYENYYENQLLLIDEDKRDLARNVIESGLINEEEERRMGLYKRQMRDLYGVSNDLLEKLINTRLIRAVRDSRGGSVYELCHDSLIQPILKAKRDRLGNEVNEELQAVKKQFRKEKKRRVAWQRIGLIFLGIAIIAVIAALSYSIDSLRKENQATTNRLTTSEELRRQNALRAKTNSLTSAALIESKLDRTVAFNLLNRALKEDPENEVAQGVKTDLINSNYSYPFYQYSLKGHNDYVTGVVAFDNGNRFISISGDSIYFWYSEGKLDKVIKGHDKRIHGLDISPDFKKIVTAGEDKRIKLWSLQGKLINDFGISHRSFINEVQFLGQDKILSGSWDTEAKLWDLDGTPLATFTEHNQAINSLASSPERNLFCLGSRDSLFFFYPKHGLYYCKRG